MGSNNREKSYRRKRVTEYFQTTITEFRPSIFLKVFFSSCFEFAFIKPQHILIFANTQL